MDVELGRPGHFTSWPLSILTVVSDVTYDYCELLYLQLDMAWPFHHTISLGVIFVPALDLSPSARRTSLTCPARIANLQQHSDAPSPS